MPSPTERELLIKSRFIKVNLVGPKMLVAFLLRTYSLFLEIIFIKL